MELAKAMRRAGVVRVLGLSAAVMWLGAAAMLAVPRIVHAQDDSAVSQDGSAADDNSNATDDNDANSDTDIDAAATPIDINGSWSGTALDKKHGSGTVTMTFTQATKAVAVTIWEVTYGDDSSAGGAGSGKLNGKSLKLVLLDPTISEKCKVDVSAKVLASGGVASEIKGNYSIKKCFVKNSSGTIDMTPAATPTPTP